VYACVFFQPHSSLLSTLPSDLLQSLYFTYCYSLCTCHKCPLSSFYGHISGYRLTLPLTRSGALLYQLICYDCFHSLTIDVVTDASTTRDDGSAMTFCIKILHCLFAVPIIFPREVQSQHRWKSCESATTSIQGCDYSKVV